MRINEIFHSIQGEGIRTGLRCVFIRLTGCHLRCTYCDTEYSFFEGDWMTLDDVLSQVAVFECGAVEVTGGEPLLQPGVYPLLARLADDYETVMLETSGAILMDRVDPRVIRILDLKTPSSGEVERNEYRNIDLLTPRDEVKFVIGTRGDYEWARDQVRERNLLQRCPVLFSPVVGHGLADAGGLKLYRGRLDPAELAAWILADRLDVRFMYQLHKLIWPATQRGV
ncbi:7-carboxy-7-deazaguanine synthase [Phycisphaerae bacterium RAS1]|nr:7-carboxy-7-deazaguanine synthase [Phycisphaerae bacterium RAS1]